MNPLDVNYIFTQITSYKKRLVLGRSPRMSTPVDIALYQAQTTLCFYCYGISMLTDNTYHIRVVFAHTSTTTVVGGKGLISIFDHVRLQLSIEHKARS